MFETWQHGTPDAALTSSWLKEAPEIDMLQHATASSIASQLKDDYDYNSCVEWAVAAASAGCNAEYDSDIDSEGSTPTYSNQVMLDRPFSPE